MMKNQEKISQNSAEAESNKKVWVKPEVEIISDIQTGTNPFLHEASAPPFSKSLYYS